jgi:hypothetical protein
MPHRPGPRQSADLGSRFRRLARVAEGRQASGTKRFRSRLRFPWLPASSEISPPLREPPRSGIPHDPPDAASIEHLRLNPSDWRTIAVHLYRLYRPHNPALADLVWQHASQVDQGFRQSLLAAQLPSAAPAARLGLNPRTVRRAYQALMHDFRVGVWTWEHKGGRLVRRLVPLATLSDNDIRDRIMDRLLTGLEPGDLQPRWDGWRWNPADAPWPRLIAAVREHTPRTAVLEILAWALGRKPSYLKYLIEHTPRRPLDL